MAACSGSSPSAAYSVAVSVMFLKDASAFSTRFSVRSSLVSDVRVTAEAASYNLYSFLNIAGFIGVNLAVFNLLPIPALDGSKVIFCLIEWIRRKPVNRKVEAMIHLVGIVFLFAFAILVDLLQLF